MTKVNSFQPNSHKYTLMVRQPDVHIFTLYLSLIHSLSLSLSLPHTHTHHIHNTPPHTRTSSHSHLLTHTHTHTPPHTHMHLLIQFSPGSCTSNPHRILTICFSSQYRPMLSTYDPSGFMGLYSFSLSVLR